MAADKFTEKEAAEIGTDAYIFGYPLVTVEYTRRMTADAVEPKAFVPQWASPPTRNFLDASLRMSPRPTRTRCTQALVRPGQGTLHPEPARRRRPLLPDSNAGRLDHRVPGPRQADHGRQGADVRHHRAELEGRAAQGVTEYKSPTNLVWIIGRFTHRHAGRLRSRACLAGQVFPGAAERVWQAVHAAQGQVDPNIDMKTAVRTR